MQLCLNDGEHELRYLTLSRVVRAWHAQKDRRAHEVQMRAANFNDVVKTLEVQPYSEQCETSLNKSMLGKHEMYITIPRRSGAYTGPSQDYMNKRKYKMTNGGC